MCAFHYQTACLHSFTRQRACIHLPDSVLAFIWDARSKPTRHQIDNRKLSQEADTNYLIDPKVFIASKLEWIVQLFSVAIISVGLLTRRFDGVSACCTTYHSFTRQRACIHLPLVIWSLLWRLFTSPKINLGCTSPKMNLGCKSPKMNLGCTSPKKCFIFVVWLGRFAPFAK